MIKTKPAKVGLAEQPNLPQKPDSIHIALVALGLLFGGTIVCAFLFDLLGLPVRPWTVGLPVALMLLGAALKYQVTSNKYQVASNKSDARQQATDRQLSTHRPPTTNSQLPPFYPPSTIHHPLSTIHYPLITFLLIILSTLAYLFWLGKPALLPVGTTVDAVHQFGLARYINEAGKLPIHATELRANLQDGLEYPPAFVTLVALLGGVLPLNLVYLLYPVAALCLALAGGTTFALAYHLLEGRMARLPLATLAAAFPLLANGYTFGSITDQNYFAMVLGEWLLLLALYFLLHWQRYPNRTNAFLFGLTVAALLIAYPTWALIPAAAFGLVTLFETGLRWQTRLSYLAGVLLPLAALAFLFLKDRLQVGLGTVANEGQVLLPDLARYSWLVILLAATGFAFYPFNKRVQSPESRVQSPEAKEEGYLSQPGTLDPEKQLWTLDSRLWTIKLNRQPSIFNLYLGLLAGEGLGFYLLKNFFEQGSYYSIYKLFYPATFFFGLLAALGLSVILNLVTSKIQPPKFFLLSSFLSPLSSFLLLALFLGATWIINPAPLRAYPVITRDMLKVGEWMTQNLKVDQYSVGYNLPYGTPAYWIQVGFLRQPQGNRAKLLLTGEPLTFEQWFYNAESEKYFFTDNLRGVNLDERLEVLYQSGNTGVLTRTPAYAEARTRRQSMTMRYKAEMSEGEIKLTAEASFTVEPSQWIRLRLRVEPVQGGAPVFEQTTPAEPDRERQEYMGIRFSVPSLKPQELYTNGLFPPVKYFDPLQPGRYSVYVELLKYDNLVERRKLFDFGFDGGYSISFDPAQRIQQGQFLFDGPLSPEVSLPPTRLEFGKDLPQLAGYELKGAARAGQNTQLSLSWFNPVGQGKNYQVLLQLQDSQGQVVSQTETIPLNGLYPVWFWPEKQPVVYSQNLKLPDKPGSYKLAVALLDPLTKEQTGWQKLDKLLEVS